MTQERDPICGCPVVTVQPNRRDRRSAARRGRPVLVVIRHRRGCVRVAKVLSDPVRVHPDGAA